MTIHAPLGPADLVIKTGQSNGGGTSGSNGVGAPTVTAGHGMEVRYQTVIDPLVEPLGAAASGFTGGSAAAFVIAAYAATGRPTFVVQTCVGGTCLLEDSELSGNPGWWDGSTLANNSILLTTLAWMHLRNLGYDVRFQGWDWCQGEGDANGSPLSAGALRTAYTAGLRDLLDRLLAGVGAAGIDTTNAKMWICRTAYPSTGDTAAYQAVRDAQDDAAAAYDDMIMGFTGSTAFPGQGLADTIHWTQTQQNTVGTAMGATYGATCDNSAFPELGPQSIAKPVLAALSD